jgi:hypothetical protein
MIQDVIIRKIEKGRARPSPDLTGDNGRRADRGSRREEPESDGDGHSVLRVPPHHCPKRAYANLERSASASAISGISGVGEKPLSAGARTA